VLYEELFQISKLLLAEEDDERTRRSSCGASSSSAAPRRDSSSSARTAPTSRSSRSARNAAGAATWSAGSAGRYDLRDAGPGGVKRGQESRDERPEIGEPVRLLRRQSQQLTVLNGRPPHLSRGLDVMTDDVSRQPPIDAFVDQDSHETLATSRSFASSRKAITCSRETVGKPSRKSSSDSPASR